MDESYAFHNPRALNFRFMLHISNQTNIRELLNTFFIWGSFYCIVFQVSKSAHTSLSSIRHWQLTVNNVVQFGTEFWRLNSRQTGLPNTTCEKITQTSGFVNSSLDISLITKPRIVQNSSCSHLICWTSYLGVETNTIWQAAYIDDGKYKSLLYI